MGLGASATNLAGQPVDPVDELFDLGAGERQRGMCKGKETAVSAVCKMYRHLTKVRLLGGCGCVTGSAKENKADGQGARK